MRLEEWLLENTMAINRDLNSRRAALEMEPRANTRIHAFVPLVECSVCH
jgi:hypothetical protein